MTRDEELRLLIEQQQKEDNGWQMPENHDVVSYSGSPGVDGFAEWYRRETAQVLPPKPKKKKLTADQHRIIEELKILAEVRRVRGMR